jgi:phage-related baseplate assembly protein
MAGCLDHTSRNALPVGGRDSEPDLAFRHQIELAAGIATAGPTESYAHYGYFRSGEVRASVSIDTDIQVFLV